MALVIKVSGKRPFFVTCDVARKPKPPHKTIWVNMLQGYYYVLDPNIDNINAQPHHLINEMKSRLKDNWEYIGYDLSY